MRVSDFTVDIEVRKMPHKEDPQAEAAYGFSRSAFTTLALVEEVRRLRGERDAERDARINTERALKEKDTAMGVLFDRLSKHGIDCSDLIP